jgi:multiple sugar transport system ATP-binding protein
MTNIFTRNILFLLLNKLQMGDILSIENDLPKIGKVNIKINNRIREKRRELPMASITLQHINKTYPGDVTAVSDLNLEIPDKECVVLVGPSGCGKSTILRMIAGLEDVSSGKLYIGDRLVNDVAPQDRRIALVLRNGTLYPRMTVYKNIAFGLSIQKLPKDEIDRRVQEAAKALGLESVLDCKPKGLTGDQRQRVVLGRAMVRHPEVLLLDEPLADRDTKLRTAMCDEIQCLHQVLNTTFVCVVKDQNEALKLGDRVVVLQNGAVQQNDTPQNLYDHPCNLFVASYIGSPSMNFVDAVISEENGVYSADICGTKVELPKHIDPEKLAPYVGKTVVLGIRPEDIAPVGLTEQHDLEGEVEGEELAGAEIDLHLDCRGSELVLRGGAASSGHRGERFALAFNHEKIHLFDKETTLAIAN